MSGKHNCTLKQEEHYPVLPKNATIYVKLKRYVLLFFLATHKNPRSHNFLRSKDSLIAERKRHMRKKNYVWIHPFSACRFEKKRDINCDLL